MTKGNKILVRRRKRRKSRLRRLIVTTLTFLSIALFSVLAYGAYLYVKADSIFTKSFNDEGRGISDLRDEAVDPSKDNVSILFLGVDMSEKRSLVEDQSRTDAMLVATVNVKDKSVKLLSIPRDSYVYIPKVCYETRINHAHAYGGTRAAIDTVEELLEIPIDYYIKLNFEAFIEVVDALNGVEVDVPYEIYEQDSQDIQDAIHIRAGMQTLNGEEALAYARTRSQDNDIERGKRQQELIKAMVKKGLSLGNILKFDDIFEAVGENMTTDMRFSEIKSFVAFGTAGKNLNIETLTLAGEDYWPGSAYYWKLDELALEETKDTLQEHLHLK